MYTKESLNHRIGRPVANASFAMLRGYVRSARRRGVSMLHTARSFSHYRKIFFDAEARKSLLERLQGKRIIDVGCGYTPYASDSMFRACHDAGIEFYGVDPLIRPDMTFDFRSRALARATGGEGSFNAGAPGLERALSTTAQELPFEDGSIDEILCGYLLFIWIDDPAAVIDILDEFYRVLKPGGVAKIYPLDDWRWFRFRNPQLDRALDQFSASQTFVHGRGDWRVQPGMLTRLAKPGLEPGIN